MSLVDHVPGIGKIFMLKALERTGGMQTQAASCCGCRSLLPATTPKKYDLISARGGMGD
jgi:hypothetical protein